MKKNILIAGASRGIGRSIANQYPADHVFGFGRSAEPADPPFAGYRKMDAREFSLAQFPELEHAALDRLFVAFAVFGPNPERALDITTDNLNELFSINCAAQLRVVKQCLRALQRASEAKVVVLISKGGLQKRIKGKGAIGYRVTKAAQLALGLSMAEPLKELGINLLLVNPGWVKGRIGGKNAPMIPDDSAKGIVRTIEALDGSAAGSMVSWDGSRLSA